MDDKRKYDPEDIESLLMHKTFEELYPEEKTFVLEHLDSSTEYESMRKTLLTVVAASNDHDRIVPDPAIKKSLLAEFGSQKKGGFTVWLNSIFVWLAPPKIEWYRKPAFQMAFASIALIIGIFVFTPSEEVRFADAAKPGDEAKTAEHQEAKTGTDGEVTKSLTNEEDNVSGEFKAKSESHNSLEITDNNNSSEDLLFAAPAEDDANFTPGVANGTNEITLDLGQESLALDAVDFDVADITLSDDDSGKDLATIEYRETIEEGIQKDVVQRTESEEESTKFLSSGSEIPTVSGNVTMEKTATRATTPVMVDDVAVDFSQLRDDQIGNAMPMELESIEISAVQISAESDINTATDVDFEGEALFSKKTAGIPVQASTRKYKDLIDLLYTAM